jgi:hypothetical protein
MPPNASDQFSTRESVFEILCCGRKPACAADCANNNSIVRLVRNLFARDVNELFLDLVSGLGNEF